MYEIYLLHTYMAISGNKLSSLFLSYSEQMLFIRSIILIRWYQKKVTLYIYFKGQNRYNIFSKLFWKKFCAIV